MTPTLDHHGGAVQLAGAARAPGVDLYAPMHKALRLMMTDTLAHLGRVDAADPEDLADALARLDALLTAGCSHLLHENRHLHPALEAVEPGSTTAGAAEHQQQLESIAALHAEAAALRAAPGAAAALRLYRHVAVFVAENLLHMQHEEAVHNPQLWRHYDDEQLRAIEQRIVAGTSVAEQAQVLRWMTPALAPSERALWFTALQRQMPPEAFANVMAQAEELLDARAVAKLRRALAQPPS